jgi:mono/diheme cytochrome c family protein
MSEPTDKQLATDQEQEFSAYEQPEQNSPDIQEIHRQVLREQFEPSEGQQRVPITLFLFFVGLAMWAGYYLSEYDGNFQANVYDGPDAFRLMDLSQSGEKQERKIDPLLLGKRIYNNCISCHQASGEGVVGQYPPLNQSRWVLGDDRILAKILLNGLNGPIEVRGATYNAQMPAWKQLSDRDIAAVLTYIRSAWDNDAPAVAEETLASVRAETVGKSVAYSAAELESLSLPSSSKESNGPTKDAKSGAEGVNNP